jgi:hypothetical protein
MFKLQFIHNCLVTDDLNILFHTLYNDSSVDEMTNIWRTGKDLEESRRLICLNVLPQSGISGVLDEIRVSPVYRPVLRQVYSHTNNINLQNEIFLFTRFLMRSISEYLVRFSQHQAMWSLLFRQTVTTLYHHASSCSTTTVTGHSCDVTFVLLNTNWTIWVSKSNWVLEPCSFLKICCVWLEDRLSRCCWYSLLSLLNCI